MNKFKIIDIRHHNGITRTDGSYPDHIGSTVELLREIKIGQRAILGYLYDKHGNEKSGGLITSPVIRLNDQENEITFSTVNSIYILKAI